MCSDSLITSDGTVLGYTKKIFKSPDGWLAGGCGRASITKKVEKFMSASVKDISTAWDSRICEEEEEILIVSPDGKIFSGTNSGYFEIDAEYQTGGSAYKLAIGAMRHGATARQAVQYAIELEPGMCGGEIQELRL